MSDSGWRLYNKMASPDGQTKAIASALALTAALYASRDPHLRAADPTPELMVERVLDIDGLPKEAIDFDAVVEALRQHYLEDGT